MNKIIMDGVGVNIIMESINNNLSFNGVAHRGRTFIATKKLYIILNNSRYRDVYSYKDVGVFVSQWYEGKLKKVEVEVGTLADYAYFYDGEFWKFSIPFFYGNIEIDFWDSLSDMQQHTKFRINDSDTDLDYLEKIGNLFVDLTMSLDKIKPRLNNSLGCGFLESSTDSLNSATNDLLSKRGNKIAIDSIRTSIENILKAYISLKLNLFKTTADSRKFGHDLKSLLDLIYGSADKHKNNKDCSYNHSHNLGKEWIKNKDYYYSGVNKLPDISNRYKSDSFDGKSSADCYILAVEIISNVLGDLVNDGKVNYS